MKNLLFSTALLLPLVVACQKNATIEPSDLLYQRWHLLQSRMLQDTSWVSNTDTLSDTEYRSDGSLIYHRNGSVIDTPCCASSRFERDKTILRFTETNACAYALCTPAAGSFTTITKLDKTLLELQTGKWIAQYVPVK